MMMVRLMGGVTLKDKKSNEELMPQLDIASMAHVIRRQRLWWFDYVQRNDDDGWVKAECFWYER